MSGERAREKLDTAFRQRARKLAAKPEARNRGAALGTFAIVAIGEQRLGISVRELQEIVRSPVISPLPNLPAWLPGIVLVRGRLVSAVDIGSLYGFSRTPQQPYLTVVTAERGELGILCDKILGFRQLFGEEVVTGAADPAARANLPSQGTTLDLITLLKVEALFTDDRILVDQSPISASA